MTEGPQVSLYVRGNCVAAVGPGGVANQGSTGLMTGDGLAFLVWREGVAMLAGKHGETAATGEQVQEILKFTEDLKAALQS